MLLAACSTPLSSARAAGIDAAPKLCATLASHEGWPEAVSTASERWDVPAPLLLAFIRQESNFRPGLGGSPSTQAPYGYPQASLATWAAYRKAAGRPEASRDDFADSVDFVAWYAAGTFERTGAPYSKVFAHYLAYSRGPAPVGPPHQGSLQNATRVAAYATAYEKDLSACPLPQSKTTEVAELGG